MLYQHLMTLSGRDVVLERDAAGRPVANVPACIAHHATGRFDWGRRSPETAELALNILHWWIPPFSDPSGTVWIGGVSVSRRVWEAHRAFSIDVVMRIAYDGGVLTARALHPWLLERIVFPGEWPC